MPPASKSPTSIREARFFFVRREFGLSPLQIRYGPERSLPSRGTPLQTPFDITTGPTSPPPPIEDSALYPQRVLIPKPPGEVARPARGGYSLAKTLNWPGDTYTRFKVGLSLISTGI